MRSGIGTTLQQTLTAEAAGVLKRAMAEAQRRGHNQVTPLHVASSLLNSPSGMLQRACLESHRHMQHPLQSRALDLCFNVALDRLPATTSISQISSSSAPLSNALIAALKRAQAHQRRGCPEQQQVPLLAVKVEMEQLVISILDDPSVSRVMREAGFSSTNAKNSLESMAANVAPSNVLTAPSPSVYGRHSQQWPSKTSRDAENVLGIISSTRRKNNPVLIGDDVSTGMVIKEIFRRIDEQAMHFRGVRVANLDPGGDAMAGIEKIVREENAAGLVVFLGNLSWCLDGQSKAEQLMADLERLISSSYCSSSKCRLWYLAISTSQTYTRFLAQFPAMETSLGFQPFQISSSNNSCSIRPRFPDAEKEVVPVNQTRSMLPKMPFKILEEPVPPDDNLSCCSDCNAKFEQESLQHASKSESVQSSDESLPLWMKDSRPKIQQFKPQSQEQILESRKKWSRICHVLHSNSRKSCSASLPVLLNDSNSSSSQTSSAENASKGVTPELSKSPSSWLSLSTAVSRQQQQQQQQQQQEEASTTGKPSLGKKCGLSLGLSTSKSSVVTELSLGDTPVTRQKPSVCTKYDTAAADDEISIFKRLYSGLSDRVPWQLEAASKVASTVTHCRIGERRTRGGTSVKQDTWMVFSGADRMGKRNMGRELARQVFGSEDNFALISLSGRNEITRGRTAIHRVAEFLGRTRSFCVVVLEDMDEADPGIKRSLVRSMESGKLADSTGRDVSLGNAVVILSISTNSGKLEDMFVGLEPCDMKLVNIPQDIPRQSLDVSVVEYMPSGELQVLERHQTSLVGEKRKSKWRQTLAKVFGQKSCCKSVALDLNLGLASCYELKSSGFTGRAFEGLDPNLVDKVVEFEEFDFEAAAENVMGKFEALAGELGVGLEIDVRCLEAMVGAAWEHKHGVETWLHQPRLANVLSQCTRGSVLQLRRSDLLP